MVVASGPLRLEDDVFPTPTGRLLPWPPRSICRSYPAQPRSAAASSRPFGAATIPTRFATTSRRWPNRSDPRAGARGVEISPRRAARAQKTLPGVLRGSLRAAFKRLTTLLQTADEEAEGIVADARVTGAYVGRHAQVTGSKPTPRREPRKPANRAPALSMKQEADRCCSGCRSAGRPWCSIPGHADPAGRGREGAGGRDGPGRHGRDRPLISRSRMPQPDGGTALTGDDDHRGVARTRRRA